VRHNFDIDVYSRPFLHSQGYQVIRFHSASLLIVRLEDFDRIGLNALQAFLDLKINRLSKGNVAETKWYSNLYKIFIDTVRFPDDFILLMYNSKYMKHFYSAKEILEFSIFWGGNRERSFSR
jgi:hypothetical protein